MKETKSEPKISIITFCFNSEAHIEETIFSVVNQSYPNKEYIIIDGGSIDGTLAIIEKYRDKVDYFVSESDGGISDAFNKGIRAATGDIIGIINSDDKLVDGALQVVANHYSSEFEIYRGICRIWDPTTGYTIDEIPTMEWPFLPIKMKVSHPSTFITKFAYQKWGNYDVNLKYAMDFDLLQRMYMQKARAIRVDEPLAIFRLGGVSQQDEKARKKELCSILRKNGANSSQVLFFNLYYTLRLFVKHIVLRSKVVAIVSKKY